MTLTSLLNVSASIFIFIFKTAYGICIKEHWNSLRGGDEFLYKMTFTNSYRTQKEGKYEY